MWRWRRKLPSSPVLFRIRRNDNHIVPAVTIATTSFATTRNTTIAASRATPRSFSSLSGGIHYSPGMFQPRLLLLDDESTTLRCDMEMGTNRRCRPDGGRFGGSIRRCFASSTDDCDGSIAGKDSKQQKQKQDDDDDDDENNNQGLHDLIRIMNERASSSANDNNDVELKEEDIETWTQEQLEQMDPKMARELQKAVARLEQEEKEKEENAQTKTTTTKQSGNNRSGSTKLPEQEEDDDDDDDKEYYGDSDSDDNDDEEEDDDEKEQDRGELVAWGAEGDVAHDAERSVTSFPNNHDNNNSNNNSPLADVIRGGLDGLNNTACRIQSTSGTKRSLFDPKQQEDPKIVARREAKKHFLLKVARESVDELALKKNMLVLDGEPILCLDIKMNKDSSRQVTLQWSLPFHILVSEEYSKIEKQYLEFKMHQHIHEKGGLKALQQHMHTTMIQKYGFPPTIRMEPATRRQIRELAQAGSFSLPSDMRMEAGGVHPQSSPEAAAAAASFTRDMLPPWIRDQLDHEQIDAGKQKIEQEEQEALRKLQAQPSQEQQPWTESTISSVDRHAVNTTTKEKKKEEDEEAKEEKDDDFFYAPGEDEYEEEEGQSENQQSKQQEQQQQQTAKRIPTAGFFEDENLNATLLTQSGKRYRKPKPKRRKKRYSIVDMFS